MIDLAGVIDLHVHTAPDVRPRCVDDVTLAQQAAAAGMRAVLIKSHHTLTADRAAIAEKVVPGIRVLGGLALNESVGGLNPAAVKAALALGARVIWMPTLSAACRLGAKGTRQGGINLLDGSGDLVRAVHEILELVAAHKVMLGTGHISIAEIRQLIPAARGAGIRRIVITHPDSPVSNIPVDVQKELSGPGIFFERCFLPTLERDGQATLPVAAIAAAIRTVGGENTVLATDLGRAGLPSPVDGMRQYLAALLEHGLTPAELDRMARLNPAYLLNL